MVLRAHPFSERPFPEWKPDPAHQTRRTRVPQLCPSDSKPASHPHTLPESLRRMPILGTRHLHECLDQLLFTLLTISPPSTRAHTHHVIWQRGGPLAHSRNDSSTFYKTATEKENSGSSPRSPRTRLRPREDKMSNKPRLCRPNDYVGGDERTHLRLPIPLR